MAVCTLGSIISGMDVKAKVDLVAATLDNFRKYLSQDDEEICGATLDAIVIIMEKSEDHINAIVDADLMPLILEQFDKV